MEEIQKKSKLDILNGPIWNKIPKYAIPVAATGILEQLFNASDIAIVGNFASTDRTTAIAAVGANSPIVGVILNLFIGISIGTNVVIANAIGQKDKKKASLAVHTSILLAIIGGLFITLLGELLSSTILKALNVPAEVLPYALDYLRIYLLGMPVIFLYNFEASIFRSTGNTKIPLLALAISGILNVVLNLIFVICFKMSVNGVAIATVIANVFSSLFLFIFLTKTKGWIHLNIKELKVNLDCTKEILKIGFPAGIQSAVFNIANVIIQSAINSLGTTVIAASSAAYNIEILVYYIFNSFSQACTTFVGQNYGAGQIKRCKRTLLLCLIEDSIISLVAILLILLGGKFFLSLFNKNTDVINLGYERLIIVFIAYCFSMIYEVLSGYLRGFGISLIPAIITTISVCGIRITWVYTVFAHNSNFSSLLLAYPISLSITTILILLAVIFYRPAHRKLSIQNNFN